MCEAIRLFAFAVCIRAREMPVTRTEEYTGKSGGLERGVNRSVQISFSMHINTYRTSYLLFELFRSVCQRGCWAHFLFVSNTHIFLRAKNKFIFFLQKSTQQKPITIIIVIYERRKKRIIYLKCSSFDNSTIILLKLCARRNKIR